MTMTSSFMSGVRTFVDLAACVTIALLDKNVGASGSVSDAPCFRVTGGQCVPFLVVSLALVSDPARRRDGESQRHYLPRKDGVIGIDELTWTLALSGRIKQRRTSA